MVQNLEKTTEGLRTGNGGYIVNEKHIILKTPSESCVLDVQEEEGNRAGGMSGRNISIVGMAAAVADEEDPTRAHLADNATLINKGIIEIYLNEMVEKYKDMVKKDNKDEERPYNFVRAYALWGGKNSLLVNDGISRIHIDQVDEEAPVYVISIGSGEKSTLINNGTIELTGKGTFATQARGMTAHALDPTIINNGDIKFHVDETSTVRVLATTKTGGALINYGNIDVKTAGRVMTIGRGGATHVLNAGKVNVDFTPHFVVQKVAFLFQNNPLACGIYEHCRAMDEPLPSIINSGELNVKMHANKDLSEPAVAFGIYSEMMPGEHTQVHKFENPGKISVTCDDDPNFTIAELGCNVQLADDVPYDIKIGKWNMAARDLSKTKDLFLCDSVHVDLSDAHICVENGKDKYAVEDLVVQTEDGKKEGHTFTVSGAETMKIETL